MMCQYDHPLFSSLTESGYETHSLESAGEPKDISPCLVLILLMNAFVCTRASLRLVLSRNFSAPLKTHGISKDFFLFIETDMAPHKSLWISDLRYPCTITI